MFDETPETAWRSRFGSDGPSDLPDLGKFLNHRSVRKFSDREVPESLIAALVAVAQSAATSSHLQLWSVISIQSTPLREKIAVMAGNQDQIRNAPWFFAFLADLSRVQGFAGDQGSFLDYSEYEIMAIVDVALAAERMVCAAESLGLGICYIGAMRNDPFQVKELLSLPELTFCPFGLCIGFPEEPLIAEIKPRLKASSIWFKEGYAVTSLAEFDERMREFYESQGIKGEFTWSMRSAKRLSSMTGREVLKEFLAEQGFGRR